MPFSTGHKNMPTGSMSGLLINVKLNKICHKTMKIEQNLSVINKVCQLQIIVHVAINYQLVYVKSNVKVFVYGDYRGYDNSS